MWAVILLGLLVGATASEQPSLWKPGYAYVYNVTAKSLTALHQLADQWSGVIYNVSLVAIPRSSSEVQLQVNNAIYSKIHANLSGGFDNPIPEEILNWKPLRLSKAPFDVIYKDGEIVDMLVDCSLSDAEVNQLKGLASMFQVDIDKEKGPIFKKYEQTVTGDCMTQYAKTVVPRYLLQSEQKIELPGLIDDTANTFIDITKERNISKCHDDRVSYFGLDQKPFNSSSAPSLALSSNSRAIVANNSNSYLLGYAETTEKAVISPFLYNQLKGMVASTMRVVLAEHHRILRADPVVTPPECSTGGLLYVHLGTPEAANTKARNYASVENREQASDEASESSESGAASYEASSRRYRRAVTPYQQFLPEPQLQSAPHQPYDALFVAAKGQSIRYDRQVNATNVAISLARDIGQALYEPSLISPKEALTKFPLLISVLRVFGYVTLQRLADQLYQEQSPENPSSQYAWTTYVMAVSQVGNGPALLNLFYMINERMLSDRVAASAYAYLPQAARAPTPQYVDKVFNFTLRDASDKYPLNVTAVLAATELIYLAQVSNVSSSRYPIETFADLLGKYNPDYVQRLAEKLKQAVDEAYSPNIQLYIRALGNIGHPDILEVFKPYLEGSIPVSNFQRFMMVMSLDKLAEAYPQVAQNVSLQLFQNTGETHEIRCASVLLLMATNPPPSVLQKLAHLTNSEQNTQVKAAVKSIIQSAVTLLRPEDSELAQSAQSAIHMLTTEEFGMDRSFGDISSYVVEDFGLAYKQLAAFIGSVDSYVHSSASVKLQRFHGPLMSHRSEVTSMVSSVRQLAQVLLNQTNEYQHLSSKDPAAKLNIQRNISEPLEGNILLDVLASKSFVAFDNTTIELLKEFLVEELLDLQDWKSYNKTILSNSASASIGFPTILGLPANVKFDAPVLISIQVNASVEIEPDDDEVFVNPKEHLHYVNITSEIKAAYASQMNSKINIIFPLESKVFESSLVQNLELYLPLQLNISHDLPQNLTTFQLQPLDPEQKYPLLLASRQPTTAVWSPMPLMNAERNRRIVHVRPLKQAQYVFGKQTTGMVFIAEYKSEAEFIDRKALADHAKKFDALSAAIFPWASEETYYYNHTLYYSPQQSSAKNVAIQIRTVVLKNAEFVAATEGRSAEQSLESDDEEEPRSYRGVHKRHPRFQYKRAVSETELEYFEALVAQMKDKELDNSDLFDELLEENLDDFEQDISKRGTVYILESKVTFQQPHGGDYRLSLMHSHNNIGTVTLTNAKYWAKSVLGRVSQGSVDTMGFFPLLPEMNFEQAINANPNSSIGISIITEHEAGKESRIYVGIKAGRSERLKQQINKGDVAQQCRQEMKQGNNVLYACRNATEQSGLLDHFSVKGYFKNLSPEFINATYKAYSAVRYLLHPFISQKTSQSPVPPAPSGEIDGYLWLSPQLDSFNASLNVPSLSVNFTNVRGWPAGKTPLVLPHPSRHVAEKISSGYEHRYIPPTCSLDKRNMTTFDNLTIPLNLPKCWTLVLSLVPRPLYNEELSYTNVSVLAMQAAPDSRKYQIIVGSHSVEQVSPKYIVVDHKKKYNLKQHETTRVEVDGVELLEGALLPSGSSWLSLPRYGLTLHFDGERALLLTNETYKGAARGLCGTYDGETVTDLTVPRNCILKDPKSFVAQYIVPELCQDDSARNLLSEAQNAPCYPFEIFPASNINDRSTPGHYGAWARSADSDEWPVSGEDYASEEAPRARSSPPSLRPVKIVKTLERGDKLAFSIEKVPWCPKPLVPDQVEWRKIPYHEIKNTPAGLHWFQQVQSSPQTFDFSKKSKSTEIRTKFHLSCKPPY